MCRMRWQLFVSEQVSLREVAGALSTHLHVQWGVHPSITGTANAVTIRCTTAEWIVMVA